MKKKALIAGVLLSICSMAVTAQAAITINSAGETVLRDDTTNYWTDLSGDASTPGLTISGDDEKTIKFDLQNKDTSKQNHAVIDMKNSSKVGTGIYHNGGTTNFEGIDLSILGVEHIGESAGGYRAIENEKGFLHFYNNVNIGAYANQDVIYNNGSITFNGNRTEISRIHETSDRNLDLLNAVIDNRSTMAISSNNVILSSSDGTKTSGKILSNHGIFHLNPNNVAGQYILYGDIEQFDSGKTWLNLNSGDSDNNIAILYGNIKGSNNNFKLNLSGQNTTWIINGAQESTVHGVSLNNKASIVLNIENSDNWNNKFKTLWLNQFASDGTGNIEITTDLANNIGDKIVFRNTTMDSINIDIINKDDNNGVPIQESDGHSVTIARIEGTNPVKVNANLSFYNQDDENESLQIVSPIIKEEDFQNMHDMLTGRDYNFVGWKTDDADDVLEKQLPSNETYINTNELEHTFKRLMDIRNDPSEVGVWIRGETGEMKIDGYGYDFNLTSGGYDWKRENNAGILFGGFGITHSVNKCDTGIIGDTKSTGYNLYGSWLGKDNNDYVDVILKYGKLDKTYGGLDKYGIFAAGSYSKDVFSIAAKYGRRYEMHNSWYYEPFAGLTYGKLSDVDFKDARGFNIHGDSINSKIANLGIQVGKKMEKRDFYYRMNLVHDFDGKMHINVPGTSTAAYSDMGGTWLKCAIGTSAKVGKNNSYYIDLERDFGSKVEKPWAISAGYRHTW